MPSAKPPTKPVPWIMIRPTSEPVIRDSIGRCVRIASANTTSVGSSIKAPRSSMRHYGRIPDVKGARPRDLVVCRNGMSPASWATIRAPTYNPITRYGNRIMNEQARLLICRWRRPRQETARRQGRQSVRNDPDRHQRATRLRHHDRGLPGLSRRKTSCPPA